MASTRTQGEVSSRLLELTTALSRDETVEAAVTHAVELIEVCLDASAVGVYEYDPDSNAATLLGSSPEYRNRSQDRLAQMLADVTEQFRQREGTAPAAKSQQTTDNTAGETPRQAEIFAPAGQEWLVHVAATEQIDYNDAERATVAGVASNLETALGRIGRCHGPPPDVGTGPSGESSTAVRQLNELTLGVDGFEHDIRQLLSVGCEYLGLETGFLSSVEGGDYEVEAVVNATGSVAEEPVYESEEMRCQATLTNEEAAPVLFADAANSEYADHPATESARACIAAQIVVDDETYGTVNFSAKTPRDSPFRPADEEFVKLVAQLISGVLARRRQVAELRQYKTIVETVDDPVYALDSEGQITFMNPAGKREFGLDEEVIGEHPSGGMNESDVEQIRAQIERLLAGDDQSTTVEFDIETVEGEQKTVENRLAVIDDEEFRGTVGVLRDITTRTRQRRQLESFQQAIESARDGVAVLADDEYTYIDETHVEMYGFDSKAELLGNSWRKLYNDEEIARLEAEAFPALESDGYWRGMVTGSRPDGSTFPAELSLTIIEDGRLVCTVRDETERRARERELKLKERAMDEATVGIQITDQTEEENPLVYVNDGFERMTGYAADDVLGEPPRVLSSDASDPEQAEQLREAIGRGQPVSTELQTTRKNGDSYWSRLSMTPVTNENGTVENYIGIQQDVTERRERSQWLQQFLSHGPLLFVETREVDGKPVVESCNSQLLDRLGYDRADVEGEPLESLYTSASVAALHNHGYETALSGEFEMNERTLVAADGSQIDTLLRAVPRRDGTSGTNALFVDISERKERERRKDATVDVLERVYQITTDPNSPFEEKLDKLLAAGSEYLDLSYGFLTQIDRGEKDDEGTQTIVEAYGGHELIQPGESCPLPNSYCRQTIKNPDLTTITDATAAGWDGDPAYELFELDTYIAGSVSTSGDTYGTVCFAAKEPREDGFTETEQSFVNLLRRWIGYEIDRKNSQAKLRQQQQRLELTLSGTNTSIVEWDLQTGAMDWSETFSQLTGLEISSIEEFESAIHPDDRERVRESFEAMIEANEPWVGEFRIVDGDGAERWIGMRTVPTYEHGEPAQVLATGTDISDRKRQERGRKRNERRYRRLAENIPNGAVLTFDDDLNYELAAGELLSTYDLAESDIVGEGVGTLFETEREVSLEDNQEIVSQMQAALSGEYTDRRVELSGRTLRVHIVPIEYDEQHPDDSNGLVLLQDVTDQARHEQKLTEERERFRLLIESISEYAFMIVDEEGVIKTWNQSGQETFGYDTETATGMSVAELHRESEQSSGVYERLLQQARIAGESASEGWHVRADGSEFYADVRYAPIEDEGGEFRGFATIVRDMSEQRQQRRRTERFVEESEDVVAIVETDGTITYASGSADRVLDYVPGDMVGENLFDYFHEESQEEAMEAFFACVNDQDAARRSEGRINAGDDEWRNIEARYRNLLDEAAINGVLVYLRDVTESKERVRKFRGIFNQTYQFTALLDPDGTVVEINNAALEFGGIRRGDIVGECFFDSSWWSHSDSVRDDAKGALRQAADGEFVRYETEVNGGDGLTTIDFSLKPVTDEDGEISFLVAEGRDITAQRQHRQHLDIMQRVMRHNMRNDLTKLRGWTQMLYQETDPTEQAEQFKKIERILDKWDTMSERMGEMRQILESDRQEQATAPPGSLIETAVDSVHGQSTTATIVTHLPDEELSPVAATISDAVRELVENAITATAAGTVEIELCHMEDEWIRVSVTDDGPGMPEMEADLLETGEETPLSHGQGLGLWMVRMIVTQAGGEIAVETTPDGTTVTLDLPTGRQPNQRVQSNMTE